MKDSKFATASLIPGNSLQGRTHLEIPQAPSLIVSAVRKDGQACGIFM